MRARPPRRRFGIGLALMLLGVAYFAIGALGRDPRDPTDEREWAAISIAHVRQLFGGVPPPGAEPGEEPWRAGVQGTTFGAVNPCFPKLVWGAALVAAGHERVEPDVFWKYHKGERERMQAAYATIDPALPLARSIVRVFAALAATACFFLAGAIGGPLAGALAYLLFLTAPLVRLWGGFARTDFFMVALSLVAVWVAYTLRESLVGRRGPRSAALAGLATGAACGLVVASKFNGAPVVAALAGWVALEWALARPASFVRGPLCSLAALGVACALVLYVLDPVLWRHPVDELRAILEFWGPHMEYQQERAAKIGVRVAHTLGERVGLASERVLGRDEAWRALTGLPGGVVPLAAGLVVLGACAAGRIRGSASAARLVLLYVAVTAAAVVLWLPLDWDRYFLPLVPCLALVEGSLPALLWRAFRRRDARARAG